jgi:anti-sigma B factor antagonist
VTDDDQPGHGGVPEFCCELLPDPGRGVVCVAGDVDMATAPVFRDVLTRATQRGDQGVLVDLSGCGFMDSSGLSVLVEANKALREQGGRLTLRAPNERIVRLLELTRLDGELLVED